MFKKLKPVTPSLRHTFTLLKNVAKKPLLKNKIKYFKKAFGKSKKHGIVTKRHKERGAKKKYRNLINNERKFFHGIVCTIEHDPYRSGFIMAVFDFAKKDFFYSLAQENIVVGDMISKDEKLKFVRNGNSQPVNTLPLGVLISSVPFNDSSSSKKGLAKSAGSYCILRSMKNKFCGLELPSGEMKFIKSTSYVTLGRVSNSLHFLKQLGKAGRSRWKGLRPKTRGVAMNPIDHPNGGGEGKKSGKKKSPWGRSNGFTNKSRRRKTSIK